jgi:hypothetical protein
VTGQYHIGALSIRLEQLQAPDARRNYKLAVRDPLPAGYGEDLYYRLGPWLDEDKTLAAAAAESSGRVA